MTRSVSAVASRRPGSGWATSTTDPPLTRGSVKAETPIERETKARRSPSPGPVRGAKCSPSAGAPSMRSSFATGLLITLGDQKAVLFYLGFLPAFMNLGLVTAPDVVVIAIVAALSVGGVKLLYAAAASRARILLGTRVAHGMNRVAAGVMIAVGLFLLTKNVLLSS